MLTVTLVVLAGSAHAAGYTVPDSGVRAMGRAGAYVVGADDLSAQYYNPAALSGLESHGLNIDLAGMIQTVRFDRADEEGLEFEPVTNAAGPMPLPRLGFSPDLDSEHWTLAFGIWSPAAPRYEYPADGAQRYALTDATLVAVNIGPSVAWRQGPVSLGVSLAWSVFRVDQTLAASTAIEGTDDPAYDIRTQITAFDAFTPTGNAGILVTPVPWLTLGASVQPPVSYRAKGSLSTDFSKNVFYTGESDFGQVIAAPDAEDDDITLPITLPLVARGGVLVRPTDRFEVEADFVYEAWSSFDELRITDLDMTIEATGGDDLLVTDDIVLPTQLDNAWSVRLGGEGAVSERVKLRAGALFETSAVPEATRSVMLPDGAKVGYGLGASYSAGARWAFDVGFMQSFVLDQQVTRTTVFQVGIDPLTGNVGYGKTVGKGMLAAANHALGVGMTWRLP